MSSNSARGPAYLAALTIAKGLLEAGDPCSVRRVRELAKGGSFSTVCKAVAAAKAEYGQPAPSPVSRPLEEPPMPPNSVAALAEEIRALAAELHGVRKHFLLQVEEARTLAAQWKARHRAAEEEKGNLDSQRRQQVAALREEISWLRGKLGMGLEAAPPTAPAPAQPGVAGAQVNRAPRYPGHPRAVSSPMDSTDGAE